MVGGIPQEPPGFLPRPDLLAELDRVGTATPAVHLLTGQRGAGTTQLAAAYARAKLAEGWRLVAWVNAENTGSLLAGLAAVADAAGLPDGGSGRGAADAGRMVRHRLETDGDRCLLVFDDATDPDVLRPFVPAVGESRVLITSTRDPDSLVSMGAGVPVDVFHADQALAFLAGRTHQLEDAPGAAALAAELGYLPLALAQAAALIAGQHLGYGMYLDHLRALPVEEYLLREESQPYPAGVAEAALLCWDAIRTADRTGVCTRLLEIIAVLSAAGVRRDLLHAAGQAGVLASGGNQVAAQLVDRALEQLADWSLVTVSLDGRTIIAHQLVTRVVRDMMASRRQLTSACWAAAFVLDRRAQTLGVAPDRLAVRDLPGQLRALMEHAGEADKELVKVLLRLRFLALYQLIELGDSASQAIAVAEPLAADLERVLGSDHLDTLNARNSLAAAYRAAGRAAEAIPLFEQTMVGRQRLLDPDHPETLNSQNNLAAAYQDAGRTDDAIQLFEVTLAAREGVLGADHSSTLNSRGNLAAAYRDAGRIDEAIPLFEATLAGRQRALGANHPDTLTSLSNLAAAYRAAGRAAEAIPLVEQTLAARERVLGPDHLSTLGARHNLAVAYQHADRAAEAIPLHEQTLAACERLMGADHPRTLSSRNSLAVAYRAAGRTAEAIPLFEATLADRERVLGADHPDTLATRKHLDLARKEASEPR